jgi:integrase/recombinase XerD
VTHLRQLMLDELQRRNYSPNTVRSYVHAVEEFARYFRRSPEQLGPDHVREYQVHLFRDRKLSPRTIEGQTAALRFLFVKTLRRPYLPDAIPFPKQHKRLPTVLSQEEVSRLIDSAGNLMHRAMVMTLYAAGVRRAELCRLKVADEIGTDVSRFRNASAFASWLGLCPEKKVSGGKVLFTKSRRVRSRATNRSRSY